MNMESAFERTIKKFMLVNRKAPHGTIYALEALDVALVVGAFEQLVSVAFADDGVYQLVKGQDTVSVGLKDFARAYKAFEDYDIRKLYVEQDSLRARGLTAGDLLVQAEAVEAQRLGELMDEQDVILSF
jgi:tRNA 2-thiouridine synthesizing protein C